MAEYIEREKVIDELEHLYEDAELSYLGVYDCIENVPTADVVEVVRCKDCRHFDGEGCLKTHGEFEPNPIDYCSYGERRCDDAK